MIGTMTMRSLVFASGLALVGCSPAKTATEPQRPTRAPAVAPAAAVDEKADLDWRGDLDELELATVEGDVKVTRAAGREARVRAFKSGPDADDVRIEVEERDGRVVVRARYPERSNTDARVDFVVEVPDGIELEAAVVSGNVDVSGVDAKVAIESVNGNVATAGARDVAASTVNGSVLVILPAPAKRAELEAVNGKLEVRLPATIGARLRASTLNGRIRSDFPMQHGGEIVGSHASAELGDGAADVKLSTVNGPIAIKKS
jgi:hypothetical protein